MAAARKMVGAEEGMEAVGKMADLGGGVGGDGSGWGDGGGGEGWRRGRRRWRRGRWLQGGMAKMEEMAVAPLFPLPPPPFPPSPPPSPQHCRHFPHVCAIFPSTAISPYTPVIFPASAIFLGATVISPFAVATGEMAAAGEMAEVAGEMAEAGGGNGRGGGGDGTTASGRWLRGRWQRRGRCCVEDGGGRGGDGGRGEDGGGSGGDDGSGDDIAAEMVAAIGEMAVTNREMMGAVTGAMAEKKIAEVGGEMAAAGEMEAAMGDLGGGAGGNKGNSIGDRDRGGDKVDGRERGGSGGGGDVGAYGLSCAPPSSRVRVASAVVNQQSLVTCKMLLEETDRAGGACPPPEGLVPSATLPSSKRQYGCAQARSCTLPRVDAAAAFVEEEEGTRWQGPRGTMATFHSKLSRQLPHKILRFSLQSGL
ncbi:hypothetical protein CBR_g28513 [Chara braunii]|uniref:Uncharacterized protein n=1 Tax=Chara braunii TaxID=69332 RepID=A0A388JW88_CHABU|nr:hypothetical protein CBR_g28513 [Chara braunii]|eukprot:GBG62037.1 hypothetical protein CBR_g28513 [Chara braunii]